MKTNIFLILIFVLFHISCNNFDKELDNNIDAKKIDAYLVGGEWWKVSTYLLDLSNSSDYGRLGITLSQYDTTTIYPRFTEDEYSEIKYVTDNHLFQYVTVYKTKAYSKGNKILSCDDDSILLTYEVVSKNKYQEMLAYEVATYPNAQSGWASFISMIRLAENNGIISITFPGKEPSDYGDRLRY